MRFYKFENVDGSNGATPELMIYGEIGGWWGDVDATDFNKQLSAIDADQINVRINSIGGDVFTAQAIYAALRRHKATINVYVDGISASAATLIQMAGDNIIMPAGAMMMVHNPMTGVFGNAEEMREVSAILDKVRAAMLHAYTSKTGLTEDEVIALLDAETYMTAAEALEKGFATKIEADLKIAATLSRSKMVVNGLSIDPERFAKMPDAWLTTAPDAVQSKASTDKGEIEPRKEPSNIQAKEKPIMNLEQLKAEHGDVYEAALAAGAQAERERIMAIEEMALAGHEVLATQAKFETGITAEAFAMQVIKAEKEAKEKFLTDRNADAQPVNKIKPSDHEGDNSVDKGVQAANILASALKGERTHMEG